MTIVSRRVEANGLVFAVDEAGEGPDVALCLHGFPEARQAWRRLLPALAADGWRAVAPDLRGYGESTRPAERDAYRMPHLLADVAGLFDALGARRRLLVGHDWGALIAWTFAIEQVRPLDGLVIMNVPHPTVFRRVLRRSWRQRGRSWYVAFFQLPWLPELLMTAGGARAVGRMLSATAASRGVFEPDYLARLRRNAAGRGAATAMLNYYRANARHFARREEAVAPIAVPVLMIWGERDVALGVELTEGYEPLVRDLELHRLPECSHWVEHEAPERINALVKEWLARKHPPFGHVPRA